MYTAYGLQIASQLALPELLLAANESPDITVQYGEVPVALAEPAATGGAWQAAPGRFLLHLEGIARYLVSAGRDIRIEPLGAEGAEAVRTFLLGSVFGALLHQRQLLILHASAIQTARGAVVFLGHSGSGKSTLLAALLRRGYAMLADDVTGLVVRDHAPPLVLPAYPATRLWADAAAKLQQPVAGLRRVSAALDKYVMPVDRFCATPLPLHAIYTLAPHNRADIRVEPLAGMHGLTPLAQHTYRRRFLQGLGLHQPHFQAMTTVIKAARVTRLSRPTYPFRLDELVDRIEETLD